MSVQLNGPGKGQVQTDRLIVVNFGLWYCSIKSDLFAELNLSIDPCKHGGSIDIGRVPGQGGCTK